MNKLKTTDFFPDVEAPDAPFAATEIFEPYRETDADLAHEKSLQKLRANIDEKLGKTPADNFGELPFNADADRKRWDELEKNFDRLFDETEQLNF